jgi:hypothetical protein
LIVAVSYTLYSDTSIYLPIYRSVYTLYIAVMRGGGIDSSIWASKHDEPRYVSQKPDWKCPLCGFMNFSRRIECLKCSSTRDGVRDTGTFMNQHEPAAMSSMTLNPRQTDTDRTRESAAIDNYGFQTATLSHHTKSISEIKPTIGSHGLEASRWAPRQEYRSSKAVDSGKIWTRVCIMTSF